LLTLVLACGDPGAFGKDKEKKVTPPPAPPQPIPQKIKVLRDSTIEITLRIYGRKNQSVTYIVRRQPTGKLTAPKNTELEAAVVQYRAPADPTITADSFEYAARSDLGVSAPALVEIEVVDIPAELVAPVEVVFEPILSGATNKQTIQVENRGGVLSEGDFLVDPPWRIEVSPHYRIEPGQRRSVAITFAPDKAGDFTSDLRFSSQPDRAITLRGKALVALEARPASLRLEPVAGALIRAAGLEIVNHTAEPQTIRVTSSARIITDAPLTLEAGHSGSIIVRTNKDDVRLLEGELVLESDAHRTVVPIRAEALPGILQAENTRLELKAAVPGGEPVGVLVIHNFGGSAASAELTADAEFQLSTSKISLPIAGETRIDVRLLSGVNPPIEGTVEIKSGGASQKIAVSAIGTPHTTAPVAKSDGKRSSKKSTSRGSESEPPPSEWSPYETDPTAPIDPVNIVRTVAMNATSCTLEWHVERTPATKFIAETRELRIENGQLAKLWHKHLAFRVERSGNHFRGTIEQLQPSRMYTVRVRGLDDQGEAGAPIFEAAITTRPPESKSVSGIWKALLGVAGVAAIAFFILRRLRAGATPAFDPKKTQRIV
jgi:hypothetical protein